MFARLFNRSAASKSRAVNAQAVAPLIENLEGRTMMSASVSGSVVTVNGDDRGVNRDGSIVQLQRIDDSAGATVIRGIGTSLGKSPPTMTSTGGSSTPAAMTVQVQPLSQVTK